MVSRILLCITLVLALITVSGTAQGQLGLPETVQSWFDQVLGFVYTFAHWIGQVVSNLLMAIWPEIKLPPDITDTVGILSVLTVFLIVAEVAKNVARIVLAVAWVFLIGRIVLLFLPAAQ